MSLFLKIGQLFKKSSRKGRKLIALEIAVTVNPYQNINSQLLKIRQLVKQSSGKSSRKGRKLIALEIAVTVNTYENINSHLLKIGQLGRQSSRKAES